MVLLSLVLSCVTYGNAWTNVGRKSVTSTYVYKTALFLQRCFIIRFKIMVFSCTYKALDIFFNIDCRDVLMSGRIDSFVALVFFVLFFVSGPASSEIHVNNASQLTDALSNVSEGERVNLASGLYTGNFAVKISAKLYCAPDVILDGAGNGNVLDVVASNVVISGCHIVNWGDDLTDMNAGIFVHTSASNFKAKDNSLNGVTFGIFVDHAESPKIIDNRIEGDLTVRSQDRGNGIHLFNVTGAVVAGNEVFHTRDGIYIDTSNKNILRDNELHHLRYGIHYMYSYSNELRGNYTCLSYTSEAAYEEDRGK